MKLLLVLGIIILIAIICAIHFSHQRLLKTRAHLMCEAIKNKDFSFKLPTKGLLSGEKALQEALNSLGDEIKRQESEKEVESWQRLTRVLTHEIMNATAPIASISQSFLMRKDVKDTPLEDGIKAINEMSKGLNVFVQNYRKLTQLQNPTPSQVNLNAFFQSIVSSYPDVVWDVKIDSATTVQTDESLLRQVIINLVKNAIEAGANSIGIKVVTSGKNATGNSIKLLVSNDGEQIPLEARREIFTPFFSTKRTGSGIGLSLSRQVMVIQGGDLTLQDISEGIYHTTFCISL